MFPHPGFTNLVPEGSFNDLVCPNCANVCFDPIVPKCGHHHCKDCALKLNRCAACPPSEEVWSPSEWEQLSEPHHRGIRNAYERVEVECKACGMNVLRGYKGDLFDQHVRVCKIECPLCNAPSTRSTFSQHEQFCEQFVVACRAKPYGCPWSGIRAKLCEHEFVCDSAKITTALDAIVHQREADKAALTAILSQVNRICTSILTDNEPAAQLRKEIQELQPLLQSFVDKGQSPEASGLEAAQVNLAKSHVGPKQCRCGRHTARVPQPHLQSSDEPMTYKCSGCGYISHDK